MGKTTLSGPIVSQGAIYRAGNGATNSISADATLTEADHAGRLVAILTADCDIILPAITGTDGSDVQPNNFGMRIDFVQLLNATDVTISPAGSDTLNGSAIMYDLDTANGVDIAAFNALSAATLTMNGTTTGGKVGSVIKCTVVAEGAWMVEAVIVADNGTTMVTPFS